mmetsp:Transcript_40190/g.74227  ORF Transcript_40190/g.74227 Transcript_40190/m.74227 type:complete len:112 (+) Transcript_40190:257-592(+)
MNLPSGRLTITLIGRQKKLLCGCCLQSYLQTMPAGFLSTTTQPSVLLLSSRCADKELRVQRGEKERRHRRGLALTIATQEEALEALKVNSDAATLAVAVVAAAVEAWPRRR